MSRAEFVTALVLALTGCWHTRILDTECVYPTTFKSGALDCAKLQTIAGALPVPPNDKPCIDGDQSDYWRCRVENLLVYAEALRRWSGTAIAVCAP